MYYCEVVFFLQKQIAGVCKYTYTRLRPNRLVVDNIKVNTSVNDEDSGFILQH